MEGFRYWRAIRRWWWMIILLTVITGTTATVISLELPKTYSTTTSALVNPYQPVVPPVVDRNGNIVGGGAAPTAQEVVQTYAGLFNALPVRQKLVADGVPRTEAQLQSEINARVRGDTTIIDITVLDQDPLVAQRVATQIVPDFNQSLNELQAQVSSANQRTRLTGIVSWEVPPSPPGLPIMPDIPQNAFKGVGAGLLAGLLFAFVLEYLDHTIKRSTDVPVQLGWTMLAEIGLHPMGGSDRGGIALATLNDPHGPLAEEYRALQTSLLLAPEGRSLKRVVVTSTAPGEGKTSTACNLALAMAEAGNDVVLVDADFRRPALHTAFDLPNDAGLAQLITSDRLDPMLVHDTASPRLKVICAGPAPTNPAALLASQGMERLVSKLLGSCDIVLFDSPPAAAVSDAVVLAASSDGVVMVVESGATPVPAIQKVRDSLKRVDARVLGVVLNKVRAAELDYYYHYYYMETRFEAPSSNGHGPASPAVTPAGKGRRESPAE